MSWQPTPVAAQVPALSLAPGAQKAPIPMAVRWAATVPLPSRTAFWWPAPGVWQAVQPVPRVPSCRTPETLGVTAWRPEIGLTVAVVVLVWQAVHARGPGAPHTAVPVAWQPRSPPAAAMQVLVPSVQPMPARTTLASSCRATAPSVRVVLTLMWVESATVPWQAVQVLPLSKCLVWEAAEIARAPVLLALAGGSPQ